MSTTFEDIGHLSAEVEAFRQGMRSQHSARFSSIEVSVRLALEDLRSIRDATGEPYLVGLGFWIRAIEACEGAVLLTERGMRAVPFSAVRTAYECLFAACALWRRPELLPKFEQSHHQERIKQARAMLNAGAQDRVLPDGLTVLEEVANELSPSGAGFSAWDAADAADLRFEYETVYRGCALAGAHASVRSLDDFYAERPDGGLSLLLEPSPERVPWLLTVIHACLRTGTERQQEARVRFSS